jgi:hypothetical protein
MIAVHGETSGRETAVTGDHSPGSTALDAPSAETARQRARAA